MNRMEHLLTCLAEECTEVGKNAAKALRFGLDDREPGQLLSNSERIVEEMRDLIAVAAILRAQGVISDFYPTPSQILDKDAKIERYMAVARKNGVLA